MELGEIAEILDLFFHGEFFAYLLRLDLLHQFHLKNIYLHLHYQVMKEYLKV